MLPATKRSGTLFHFFLYGRCRFKISTALNPKKMAIQLFLFGQRSTGIVKQRFSALSRYFWWQPENLNTAGEASRLEGIPYGLSQLQQSPEHYREGVFRNNSLIRGSGGKNAFLFNSPNSSFEYSNLL